MSCENSRGAQVDTDSKRTSNKQLNSHNNLDWLCGSKGIANYIPKWHEPAANSYILSTSQHNMSKRFNILSLLA